MSHQPDDKGLFDNPVVVTWILRVFYFICVALVVFDFFVHRHIYTPLENVPAFYAIYGFVACVLLVFAAKGLRHILMRKETYYDSEAGQTANEDDC